MSTKKTTTDEELNSKLLTSESSPNTPIINMGVASLSSKRRLEIPPESPTSPKMAKKSIDLEPISSSDPSPEKWSSEFLTTSILARTLLTTSPLESLKSSLEALPPPTTFLESLEEIHRRELMTITRSSTEYSNLDEGTDWILPMKNPNVMVSVSDQLITEDENGKSYFNLGPSESMTVLARKRSSTNGNGGDGGDYLDESSSSSSCESISSEDLFNSCEEYDEDPSEDEEESRSYKQERSNVLHLSLCKLNSFRTQQCVEPSLHRSVLICNTLRHIEQEIRDEDQVKKSTEFPQLPRDPLPPLSFWGNRTSPSTPPPPSPTPQPPLMSNGDPYLSSYTESPYSLAAYTPFHSTNYEYSELEPEIIASPAPSILECDSGYSEDSTLNNYYYSQSEYTTTTTPPPPPPAYPQPIRSEETTTTKEIPKESNNNRISPDFTLESTWSPTPLPKTTPLLTSVVTSFAQQESQCGMESLRSDYCLLGNTSSHYQHLPMDTLISSNYSST